MGGVTFIGLLMTTAAVAVVAAYEDEGFAIAAAVGFATFAWFNIALGFTANSETASTLNRDVISATRRTLSIPTPSRSLAALADR